jgi:uroporphyrinogen decarboxylase
MALAGEEPDRCPMQVSFTPEFAQRLREDLGIEGTLNAARQGEHNPLGGGNTHELERAIGVDLILSSFGWAGEIHHGLGSYTDEWGVGWQEQAYETPFGVGHYTEIVGHPLADDDAIAAYEPPDPHRPELYTDAQAVIDAFSDEYWIVGVTQCTAWETAWALRGFERMLMDFVDNPDLAEDSFPFESGQGLGWWVFALNETNIAQEVRATVACMGFEPPGE